MPMPEQPNIYDDEEKSPADGLLLVLERLKKLDPKAADRFAADYLEKEGGFTIKHNPDGSCSVILEHSDLPANPYEALCYAIRKRAQENALTTPSDKTFH